MEDILFLSLRPEYTGLIIKGDKRVELRKSKPQIEEGGLILLYSVRPVKAIEGLAEVVSVVKKPLQELWEEVSGLTGGTEKDFYSYYYQKEYGVAIYLKEVWPIAPSISLEEIKELIPSFRPPQNFLYLDPLDFKENWKNIIEKRSSYRLDSIK